MFDVWLTLGFGGLGYVMKRYRVPITPMILGLVLSATLEQSLRQALTLSGGDWTVFVTQPIALVFVVLAVLALVVPAFLSRRQRAALAAGPQAS